MQPRKFRTTPLHLILLAIMLAVPFLLAATPVQAAAAGQDVDHTRLENALRREQIALANQAQRLERASLSAGKVQDLIDRLAAGGKDTAALEQALADFEASLAVAESEHAAAAAILAAPAGFDASGQVTDAKLALETVRTAGAALRRAHLELTQATLALRAALRAYKQSLPARQP